MSEAVAAPAAPVAPEAQAPAAPVEKVELSLDISAADDGADGGAPADEIVEAPEGDVVQYNKTDDVGLDMALGFIGKLGIGPAHPAVKAAQQGDFSYLKAELAGRGPKAQGWEQYVALAEKAYDTATTRATESATKTRQVVEQAVGGAENWTAIQSWAKQNAEPEERAQFNAMLNQGGFAAQAAAKLLADLYNQANDTVKEPASAATGSRSAAPSSNGALSPAEYQAALGALIAKVGAHRVGDSPEYKQLQSRRRAFRG